MNLMKKFLFISISAFMCVIPSLPSQVIASEIDIDPIQADLDLYGSQIIEEDVIYDEALGIDKVREEYLKNNLSRGAVYDDPSTYDSVYHRYTCHYDFAGGTKNPYNLEPYVADKGYWGFVSNACQ